jgi:Mce-associated membrane protein
MNPTYYDVLGVSRDAERDEIRAAWLAAAERFEPGSGAGGAQFRLFNQAAEVLLDPQRRAAYDEELEEAAPGEPEPAPEPDAEPDAGPDAEPAPEPEPGTAAEATAETTAEAQPAAETGTESAHGDGEPAGESDAPSSRFAVAVLVALGLVAALTVGAAVYLGVRYQHAAEYRSALQSAPASAERAAAAVLAYDYKSLDADRDAAAKFLTDRYRKQYVDTFNSLVVDSARQTKAHVTAKVLASAPMNAGGADNPDRVPVLLFVNQTTVSSASEGKPNVALNRVRLDMVQRDGSWLVDGITSY